MGPKDVLIQERENKMLTQSAMAKKLGLSLRNYQRYEEGLFPKHKTDVILKIDQLLVPIYSACFTTINYIKAPSRSSY